MKRIGFVFGLFLISCGVSFGETFKTGDSMDYFPKAAPKVANKSGDSSSCYIAKIAKAVGYPEGTYELQLTSADWVGPSVFPVTFTYIVKENDVLDMDFIRSIYSGREPIKLLIKSISDNTIEVEKQSDSYGDITPTEDSL